MRHSPLLHSLTSYPLLYRRGLHRAPISRDGGWTKKGYFHVRRTLDSRTSTAFSMVLELAPCQPQWLPTMQSLMKGEIRRKSKEGAWLLKAMEAWLHTRPCTATLPMHNRTSYLGRHPLPRVETCPSTRPPPCPQPKGPVSAGSKPTCTTCSG